MHLEFESYCLPIEKLGSIFRSLKSGSRDYSNVCFASIPLPVLTGWRSDRRYAFLQGESRLPEMTRVTVDDVDATPDLSSLGLIEYLQCDPRPGFILDKGVASARELTSSHLVFSNNALQSDNELLDAIKTLLDRPNTTVINDDQIHGFSTWLHSRFASGSISFGGLLWSSACLHERWMIVSGCHPSTLFNNDERDVDRQSTFMRGENKLPVSRSIQSTNFNDQDASLRSVSDPKTISEATFQGDTPSTFAKAFGVKPTQHNLMVLGFDWAKTSLGPIHAWPGVLRQMVPYMLSGLQPSAILWGDERTMIYNEAYVSMIRALHPGALGHSAKLVFGSFWDNEREPEWRAAELHGAVVHENTQIFMDRSGFLEEVYFTYTITPLWDTNGRFCGADTRCFETTRQMVVEARMLSLLKISESVTSVTSVEDFWYSLTESMAGNISDFPLFAIYSLSDADLISNTVAVGSDAFASGHSLVLRGSAGFPSDNFSIPDLLDAESETVFASAFRAVLNKTGPMLFGEGDSPLLAELLARCDTQGPRLKCNQVVVYPLHSSSRDIMGFLILGINPHRLYDDEYEIFVRLLSRQIETQLSPIIALVDERTRSQMMAQKAEYEQLLLTAQLEQQTLEAQRSESRFLKFAEQAPVSHAFVISELLNLIFD